MRIIGVRADGAQLVAVGAGVSVILRGDQKSKPLDDRKAEKMGPWTPQGDNLADRRSVQKQLDRARVVLKLSQPMPPQTFNLVGPGKHSQKWHDCWEKVQAQGHDESSAAAICTAQLGEESYDASIAEEVPDAMELGGAGSGNFGHAGRPGSVGGSGGGDGGGGGGEKERPKTAPAFVPWGADYESKGGKERPKTAPAFVPWGADFESREDPQWTKQEERVAKAIEGPGQHTFEQGGAHGPRDEHFERGGSAPSTPRAGGGETLEWKNEEPALPKYKPNPSESKGYTTGGKPTAADRAARSAAQTEQLTKENPAMKKGEWKPTAADRAARLAVQTDRLMKENPALTKVEAELKTGAFKPSGGTERAAAIRRGNLTAGGVREEKQRKRDAQMAKGRDTQRMVRAIRQRDKSLSVGEMVRIIGNVRGQGQTGRVLRVDADTALVDGLGRFNLMDLAGFGKPKAPQAEKPTAPEEPSAPQEMAAPSGEGAIVKAIKPSEPIGGDRIKKQKPVLAKPLYNVAAVRKPKIKIVESIGPTEPEKRA